MSVSLEVRGAATAIYRTSIHTLKRLWPATGLVFIVLLLHVFIDGLIQAHAPLSVRWLWLLLAQVVVTIAVAPYVVNAYRCALGLEVRSLRNLLRERDPLLNLMAWLLAGVLVTAIATSIWNLRAEIALPAPLLVVGGVALWWARIRLSLVGLVLAVDDLPLTPRTVAAATAGQIGSLTFIGLFLAVPLLPFVVAVMLVAYAAHSIGSDPKTVVAILTSPLALLGIVLGPTFEVEIYKRLSLPLPAASHLS